MGHPCLMFNMGTAMHVCKRPIAQHTLLYIHFFHQRFLCLVGIHTGTGVEVECEEGSCCRSGMSVNSSKGSAAAADLKDI